MDCLNNDVTFFFWRKAIYLNGAETNIRIQKQNFILWSCRTRNTTHY